MSLFGPVISYAFLHLSIQEFLAAWHVSCHQELINEVTQVMFVIAPYYLNSGPRPHLNTFGRFLAGLVGCDQFWFDQNIPLGTFNFHCLYEAQDFGYRTEYCQSLQKFVAWPSLLNPLDMYVFGYILVHAPIKWRISPQTSFDVLVSSIVEHTPCGEILGQLVH